MTRLLILITLLYVLNVPPPVAIWKSSNNALADTAPEGSPSKQQIQPAQRLLRPDITQQRLQQTVPADPNRQIDSPLKQQLQTPQRPLGPDVIPQRRQQTESAAPKAEINPPRQVVTRGQPAVFDSKSIADPDTPITGHQWSGPSGQTSNSQRFVVDTTNLKPSTYPVTLIVRDRQQRQGLDRATLVVEAKPRDDADTHTRPPVAKINRAALEVQQGEPARFSSASYHPDRNGKITRTLWQTSWGQKASGDYIDIDTRGLNPGEYRVRLEVTDGQSLTARDEALLIVVEPPRDVDAAIVQLDVWSAPVSPNREVQIRAMVANRGKDALRNVPVRFETGATRIAEKTLASLAGGETQEVTAIWIPKSGGEQSIIATVNPDNQPPESNRANNVRRRSIVVLTEPVIKIAPSPLEVRQGDTAKFTGQATFPGQQGGREVKYFWRGPGNRTGQGAEFQLDTIELSPGDHKIVLEISDSSGFKATANTTLTVRGAKAEVWLAADNQSPETGGNVRFTAGTRPALKQVQYKFIFGDDKQTEWSAGAEAVHRYETSGDYTARLLARRNGVDLGETFIGLSVKDIAYAVSLRTETESVRAGDPLAFIANVEPPADDIEYLFRFGDGRDSGWTQSPTASHSYSGDGAYTATVEARIRGSRTVPGPAIRVSVSTSPQLPWFWLGAGLAALAAASAAYMRKTRLARIDGGFSIAPQLNLEHLHVEAQGKLNSGCAIGLRAVRGQSRFDIEAPGPLVYSRNG